MDREVERIVRLALEEDLGSPFTDATTDAVVGREAALGTVVANEAGIMAGQSVAAAVFETVDSKIAYEPVVQDGAPFKASQPVGRVSGPLKSILNAERTALNFLARMAGVATATRRMVVAVGEAKTEVFDTRKTTPGLRSLEKYAVRMGGGQNHRRGLFDGVLIKDNHLVGRVISDAVAAARKAKPEGEIAVEVESVDQLQEAIEAGADLVLLDNMALDSLTEAVGNAKGKVKVEVTGGLSAENVGAVAALGPDRISAGAITQGAKPIDLTLKIEQVVKA